MLATLNVFAFTLHSALDCLSDLWRQCRDKAGPRCRFFEKLRVLAESVFFPDWTPLLETVLGGRQLVGRPDLACSTRAVIAAANDRGGLHTPLLYALLPTHPLLCVLPASGGLQMADTQLEFAVADSIRRCLKICCWVAIMVRKSLSMSACSSFSLRT